MRASTRLLLACLTSTVMACGPLEPLPATNACAQPSVVPDQPERQCTLEVAAIVDPSRATTLVPVGFYLTVPQDGTPPLRPWTKADAEVLARDTLARTEQILAACDLGLELIAAEVIAVPTSMQTFEGNAADSWGGQAPADEADPDSFNYARDERLAEEPRALFAVRDALPPGALAIFVVDDIIYQAAQIPTAAGGLSYAPIVFHHADDFPLRNAVLAAGAYPGLGEIPAAVNGRTIAHELSHMLLNTGVHVSEENEGANDNLMLGGEQLVEGQCAIMRDNIASLYGVDPIVDPLAP